MKGIIHKLVTHGSDRGVSWHQRTILCPKRQVLDNELGSSPQTKEMYIGTLYHAYHEIAGRLRTDRFNTEAVIFVDENEERITPPEEVRLAAEHLFRNYRLLYPWDTLGKPIAIEVTCELEASFFDPAFRGEKLTGRLDRVVQIHVQHALRLKRLRGVDVKPGFYVVDYKTDGSWQNAAAHAKHLHNLQPLVYQILWNEAHPEMRLNGALIDVAHKRPQPPVYSLLQIGSAGEDALRMVSAMLKLSQRLRSSSEPLANPFACFSGYQPCPHLVTERCPRY
jgi:hypothetical protein